MLVKMLAITIVGIMSLYPKMGTVQRIENNNCYIIDTTGDVWQATDVNLKVGDKCRLIMSTNNTPTIYDDCIIEIEKVK